MFKMNRGLRSFSQCKSIRNLFSSSAFLQNVEPLTIPRADNEPQPISPKIQKMVEDIANLTLVEVVELSKTLKQTLNLPDAPFMAMSAAPSAVASETDKEEGPKIVKTNYTVRLTKYDDSKKVTLIKEVKCLMEDMNLVQAKKFVESAPVVLKSNIGKEEAEKLKEALENCGAEIVID